MKKLLYLLEKTISLKLIVIITLVFGALGLYATTTENFNSGAYIIDMGSSNQTVAKGLKPYGLVYDLIMNENVPVRWAIEPNKAKDGNDFSANGNSYRGGSFIIPVEYVSTSVIATINTWKAKGVKVDGPVSATFSAPVYTELTSWPRAVLDQKNGDIVAGYYDNAEIPSSSYQLAGKPSDLTGCGDIYVMPHADPHKWDDSEGQALYNFIVNDGGYLWAACHAVSALETLVDFNNDGNPDCNFLSDEKLIEWDDHSDGTPPYSYDPSASGDPIMQFIGKIDGATQNGSEQVFIPFANMTWRSSTTNAIYDPDHSQNPNNDYGSILAYGHAFGNTSNGMIMYMAGHRHNRKKAGDPITTEMVSAQRAYFNFVLMAASDKEITATSTVPATVPSGQSINISAQGSDGSAPYTYEWSSTCNGGSFGDPNAASTTYNAPNVNTPTTCVITVKITDNCGRFTYESTAVTVAQLNGPTAVDDIASTPMNTPVDIDVLANDTPGDGALDPTTVTFVGGTEPNPTTEGSFTADPTTGLVTFTPVSGFTGQVTIDYQICDVNALCSTATITVDVTTVAGPTAVDDQASTSINTPVDINALSNDTPGAAPLDPSTVTFDPTTAPDPATEGVFTVHPTSGLVTFTPVEDYTGVVDIDYEVCDDNALCATATITVNIIETGTDTDGDGCNDDVDDYPNDPTRCFDNWYPAAGDGTLAYEDLWPGKGDYDFNDLVLDYRFNAVTNGDNKIVEVFGNFTVRAFGAGYENGFGFQLANDQIAQTDLTVTGAVINGSYVSMDPNGLEDGQSKPTVIVYDNAFDLMPHPGQGIGVNTTLGAPYVEPVTVNIHMGLGQTIYTLNQLDIANFNPFIMVNQNRGVEVHLPDYEPTDLADPAYFTTFDDDSDAGSGRYYKTANNLPWAIHIPESFDYPIEKQDIIWVHLKFAEWAQSNGVDFQDWYKDEPGYRNNGLIYTHE